MGKHNRIVTFHSGGDVVPGGFFANRFILGSNELVEMGFQGSGARGFCVLRVEFDHFGMYYSCKDSHRSRHQIVS